MLLLKILAGFILVYIIAKVVRWFGSGDNQPLFLDVLWDNFEDSDSSDSGSSDSGSGGD